MIQKYFYLQNYMTRCIIDVAYIDSAFIHKFVWKPLLCNLSYLVWSCSVGIFEISALPLIKSVVRKWLFGNLSSSEIAPKTFPTENRYSDDPLEPDEVNIWKGKKVRVAPSKLTLDSLYSTKISYCASTKSILKIYYID